MSNAKCVNIPQTRDELKHAEAAINQQKSHVPYPHVYVHAQPYDINPYKLYHS